MKQSYHVRIRPSGVAEFRDVDFESRPITVWHEDDEHVVFKIPSGKHWSSILEPSVSHPGQYLVTKIENRDRPPHADKDSKYYVVSHLFSMPLSNRGRGRET